MKCRYWLLAALATGILFGGTAVGMYESRIFRRVSNELALTAPRGRVLEAVNTLTSLRRGGVTDVIESKERDLSEGIYVLYVSFPAKMSSDEITVKALKMSARYRADHPFKSGNADVDRAVEQALARVGTNPTAVPGQRNAAPSAK